MCKLRLSPRKNLRIEQFESREMMAIDLSSALIPDSSLDGTGNNLIHGDWGSTDEPLLRFSEAVYSDGYNFPAGAWLASAREISNEVNAQTESISNERGLTDLLWVFGQFLDHDISITESQSPKESFDISVPAGDLYFDPFSTGTQTISFSRSIYEGGEKDGAPREQINQITAFIDGSVVYGSSIERMHALREFSGGLLKTSAGNLLPFNTEGVENGGGSSESLFLAGDVRANENIALTAMHTLWVREHNRLANEIQLSNPDLTDEEIFQSARAIVRAQLQSITFNEFLPALLGEDAIDRYGGYDNTVNPGIANEFSTAAYRFGHSMLSSELLRLNADGTVATEGNIALQNAFFNPREIIDHGIDSILQGVASQIGQELDTQVVDDIRNFLFGPPGAGGFDLAALNIQRGRDHGIGSYNQTRIAIGLEPVSDFSEITSDPVLQGRLAEVYSSVDDVELWVGGLAEDHLLGASLGETFSRILVDQFSRLRDGDRFWYQNLFDSEQIQQIEQTTLADLIARNSNVSNLQDNVFFAASEQPVAKKDRLVIALPRSDQFVRVAVRDGRVDVIANGFKERTLLLGDEQLVIRGTSRNDNIIVDLRDSSVNSLSRIVVNAGAGNDHVRIVGVHPDFEGSLRINGQKGDDHVQARRVNHRLSIYGGAGHDELHGGNHADRIFGGGGSDRIFAGSGDDLISGGRGNDRIDGGDGRDQMIERIASDTVIDRHAMESSHRERDRFFAIESAVLFTLQDDVSVVDEFFGSTLKLRRRN